MSGLAGIGLAAANHDFPERLAPVLVAARRAHAQGTRVRPACAPAPAGASVSVSGAGDAVLCADMMQPMFMANVD
jgi:hypothetical protein